MCTHYFVIPLMLSCCACPVRLLVITLQKMHDETKSCFAEHQEALSAVISKVQRDIERPRWKMPIHAQKKLQKHDFFWKYFQDLHQVERYVAANRTSPFASILKRSIPPSKAHELFEIWDVQQEPGVHAEMRPANYVAQHQATPGFITDSICHIGIAFWPCPMLQLVLST